MKLKKHELFHQLTEAWSEFHALLNSLSEQDFQRKSLNPGWTNGEILAHITFGFIILNVLLPLARIWGIFPRDSSKWFAWFLNTVTVLFNWINELGARGQGKIFTRIRIGKIYDRAHFSILNKINSIKDDEWERGMYYPTKWDANFDEFMTLEKLFYYPIVHFHFHKKQISP